MVKVSNALICHLQCHLANLICVRFGVQPVTLSTDYKIQHLYHDAWRLKFCSVFPATIQGLSRPQNWEFLWGAALKPSSVHSKLQ